LQVFELLTGEYLFDPKESRTYRKDEDHVAQMIELLGDFPQSFIRSGMYSNDIFNNRGMFLTRTFSSRRAPSQYSSIDVLGSGCSIKREI
jgi:hypothetical protein